MQKKVLTMMEIDDIIAEHKAGVSIWAIANNHNINAKRVDDIINNADHVERYVNVGLTDTQKRIVKHHYLRGEGINVLMQKAGADAWSVMEYLESEVFDAYRVREHIDEIKNMYYAGYDASETALRYNVTIRTAKAVYASFAKKDMTVDYLSGISLDELSEMYEMDVDTIANTVRRTVDRTLKMEVLKNEKQNNNI